MYRMYDKLPPSLFADLFEQTDEGITIYTNRTRQIDVYLNEDDDDEEPIREYVFTCLTANSDGALLSYLVSEREYNLSDTSESHVAGRFIFFGYFDDAETVSDVYAVAEEPAKFLASSVEEVEITYLQRRGENQPGKFLYRTYVCVYTILRGPR